MTHENPRSAPQILLDAVQMALNGEDPASKAGLVRFIELNERVRELGARSRGVKGIPQTGDWIRVAQGALIKHHGIYLSHDEVIHATKKHGVISTSFKTFSKGKRVTVVQRCPPGREEEFARRARDLKGASYDLLLANCEHLASQVHEGEASSAQLEIALFAALLGGLGVTVHRLP